MKFTLLKALLLSSVALAGPGLRAQDFNNYEPLAQSGRFPLEFSKQSSKKYQEQLAQVNAKKRYERKAQENFYLESNFVIDELLHSGKILFNDPITGYLNEVADKLLEDESELRSQVQFYTVRSTAVNAFATQNGLIFVTMGLLAQLENEAQLAYILAHEVMHYKLKHGISSAVTGEALRRGKSNYRSMSFDERLEAKSMFNKEQELESDAEGLRLFLTTDYQARQVVPTFDVLQYSYLPFNEIKLRPDFLGSKLLQFPDNYFLSEVAAIAPPEELERKHASITHPDISQRRELIHAELITHNADRGEKFLVSELTFHRVQTMARFELSLLYNLESEFEKSIYNSYLLLQDYPKSQYLYQQVAKSLYMLSLYANNEKFVKVHTVYDNIEGESQQLNHQLEKMGATEINLTALHFVRRAVEKFPESAVLQRYQQLLIQELAYEHFKDYGALEAASKQTVFNKEITSEESNNKYSKVRKYQEEEAAYFAPLLKKYKDDEWFTGPYQQAIAHPRKDPFKPTVKQIRKYEKRIAKKGRKLGIDKLAIVNTTYTKIDVRKKNKVQYVASEEAHQNFNRKLVEISRQAGVETQIIGGKSYEANEADRLADQVRLQNWLAQRSQFNDLDKMEFINLDEATVNRLVEKYGTPYFAWAGRIAYTQSNTRLLYQLLGSALIYPAAPFWLPRIFSAEHETLEIMLVFDITDGRLLMSQVNNFEHKDTDSFRDAHLYDTFHQINQD